MILTFPKHILHYIITPINMFLTPLSIVIHITSMNAISHISVKTCAHPPPYSNMTAPARRTPAREPAPFFIAAPEKIGGLVVVADPDPDEVGPTGLPVPIGPVVEVITVVVNEVGSTVVETGEIEAEAVLEAVMEDAVVVTVELPAMQATTQAARPGPQSKISPVGGFSRHVWEAAWQPQVSPKSKQPKYCAAQKA